MRSLLGLALWFAPTAGAVAENGFRSFERAVLIELNRARAEPGRLAGDLRRYRATIRGVVAFGPESAGGVLTREGVAVVDETIAFLERQPPLPTLADSGVLAAVARGLVAEQARTGGVGHLSRDGRDPHARVRAAGGTAHAGQTVAYGFDLPAAAVRQLIVDDGVPDRGHRQLVFAPSLRFAGVGCATHPAYRRACAIDFAGAGHGGPAKPR